MRTIGISCILAAAVVLSFTRGASAQTGSAPIPTITRSNLSPLSGGSLCIEDISLPDSISDATTVIVTLHVPCVDLGSRGAMGHIRNMRPRESGPSGRSSGAIAAVDDRSVNAQGAALMLVGNSNPGNQPMPMAMTAGRKQVTSERSESGMELPIGSKRNAWQGGGQYIELVVADNLTPIIIPTEQRTVVVPFRGDHPTIRALLCDSLSGCYQNNAAMDGRRYDPSTGRWEALPSGPVLTLNHPYEDECDSIEYLDFHVRGFIPGLYRVRVSVNEAPIATLSVPGPYVLNMHQEHPGKHTIVLELVDVGGTPVPGDYTRVVRTICGGGNGAK